LSWSIDWGTHQARGQGSALQRGDKVSRSTVERQRIRRTTYLNSGEVTNILASCGSSGNSAIISPICSRRKQESAYQINFKWLTG